VATPKIWYFPDGLNPYTGPATIEEIDLLEGVTRLDEQIESLTTDGDTISGRIYTAHWRTRLRIRLALERFTSDALYRQLLTLQSHLNRGGTMGFARDSSKAWAGYTRSVLQAGATSLYTGGNTWQPTSSTVTLTSGDELWIQSPPQYGVQELTTMSAYDAAGIYTVAGLKYSHFGEVLVRWRDYYPALCLPPGAKAQIVTTDRRIAHTLDVELVEELSILQGWSGFDEGAMRTSTSGETGHVPRSEGGVSTGRIF
jgi:hypothetical protein